MASQPLSRDELAERYFDQLPYDPYPVQEEALLAWFSSEQGVLMCAPTGTGKTLVAEAALFEALHTGTKAYYTTPLIALTEQKYREMQQQAVRWGFSVNNVGLVTGNRRENADAPILIVVAEILFNRLLHGEAFDFGDVSAVVMDEFHSFADRERGIVWEFSIGLLPEHVRTLMLSATVGNSMEFINWLRNANSRNVELVQSTDRKVPLTYQWVPDKLLTEQLEGMATGDEESRMTPALVFCFNRETCWSAAEQIKGKKVLNGSQQAELAEALKEYDWSQGAGPKLRQLLLRGVGVHHAGVLPKYRRIVEELFQRKLLSIATCTETLAAGINLPARSVVLPNILKGPPGKKRLMEASTAHQIFGRAGRPQFDSQGYVFVLPHEDDVRIARWREEFDKIPEKTKDPGLLKAKKRLKKKMPKRRSTVQYWNEDQFNKLRDSPPGNLYSKGFLPWRLLAYMLDASADVSVLRKLVGKRLTTDKGRKKGMETLDDMLLTLWRAGYVELEPEPPKGRGQFEEENTDSPKDSTEQTDTTQVESSTPRLFLDLTAGGSGKLEELPANPKKEEGPPPYQAEFARPTPDLGRLMMLRGVNPLYGIFLVNQLGIANRAERIQAMESVLELPPSIGYYVHVPDPDDLPPGPLATTRLDEQLVRLGLATPEEITGTPRDPEEPYQRRRTFEEERKWAMPLADKLRLLFNYDFPGVHDVRTRAVWAAGELLEFGGDFNKYVTSKSLQKQEGVVFRHFLRLILLIGEFKQFCPPDTTEDEWQGDLTEIAQVLTESCRAVDPTSTEKTLEQAAAMEEDGSEDD